MEKHHRNIDVKHNPNKGELSLVNWKFNTASRWGAHLLFNFKLKTKENDK